MKKVIFHLVLYSLLIIASCAKMGSLSGGLKDITPPKVLNSKPENYSTNFSGKRIEITFNEFLILKDISKEFVISPPLKEKPDIRLKNKTIVIDLNNELKENTTYTLNFGKAITDNNEGNILINYEFVFSTGKLLDSLSVEGMVLNSFDLQPSKDPVIIMLYNQLDDSIPLKEIPVYVGKSDAKGAFMINNISADTYKIFVLKDQNFNFLFDLPNEEIAFADTFIPLIPDFLKTLPKEKEEKDTVPRRPIIKQKVPLRTVADEGKVEKADSIIKRKYSLPAIYLDLFYFTEEPKLQYLTFNNRKSPEQIEFGFNIPLKEELTINPLNFKPAGEWYLPEISMNRDSFNLWIVDTNLIHQDTLNIELIYPALDSSGNKYSRADTIKFLYRKPVKIKTRKTEEKEKEEIKKLSVSTVRNKSNHDVNRPIPIAFNFPLLKTDTSLISLFMTQDSVEREIPFKLKKDSISLKKMILQNKWIEKTPYRLLILPGAFTDIYGLSNDTIKAVFNTTEIESYGTLILNVADVTMPMVVQLMNNKENVLEERYIKEDSKLVLEYLTPGQYIIKFIHDRNNNKKWDTGNYLMRIQPEKVSYYKDEISIRANWELEIDYSAKTDY